MTNKFPILLLICLIATTTHAQKRIEISHYLFPQFTAGNVLMKDGTLNPAMLNYNAITKEIVFQQNGQVLALADPALSLTDTVLISDRKLVPFDDEFAEVILNGDVKLLALLRPASTRHLVVSGTVAMHEMYRYREAGCERVYVGASPR